MPNIPLPPFNKEALHNLIDSASKLLPSEQSREDVQQNIQLLLQGVVSKMDLVTREEFDAQTAVLHRLQKRVALLEEKFAELENK